MTARLQPGSRAELGTLLWLFTRAAGRVTRTPPPQVFTVLGRNHRLFWGWLHFAGTLMPGGRLPRAQTELVILRVASVRGSDYEFAHHARLGRRVGLSEADIARVHEGPTAAGWSAQQSLLLRVTDELLTTRDLSEATWAELAAALDVPGRLELLMLVGNYDMLATTLRALRLPPD